MPKIKKKNCSCIDRPLHALCMQIQKSMLFCRSLEMTLTSNSVTQFDISTAMLRNSCHEKVNKTSLKITFLFWQLTFVFGWYKMLQAWKMMPQISNNNYINYRIKFTIFNTNFKMSTNFKFYNTVKQRC